ncbi:hypothetical protein LPJ61_000561 [Coemansia biformis]|uniref:Small acidic protein n=1 Tax=Coemansia biformis TaxID=1286918 RepID=A0A9W7YGT9_9FUNG|nr:hypothetical protein LPJ61_000561 [Coemansia biformis]
MGRPDRSPPGKDTSKESRRSRKRKDTGGEAKLEVVRDPAEFKHTKAKKSKKDKEGSKQSKKDKEGNKQSKKDKKVKKSKARSVSEGTSQPANEASETNKASEASGSSGAVAASGWNNWSAAEFSSDARKAKFLRFMGIGKGGAGTGSAPQQASPFESAISTAGASRIQADLEKQFGAGIQQRQQGRRGGLGF